MRFSPDNAQPTRTRMHEGTYRVLEALHFPNYAGESGLAARLCRAVYDLMTRGALSP